MAHICTTSRLGQRSRTSLDRVRHASCTEVQKFRAYAFLFMVLFHLILISYIHLISSAYPFPPPTPSKWTLSMCRLTSSIQPDTLGCALQPGILAGSTPKIQRALVIRPSKNISQSPPRAPKTKIFSHKTTSAKCTLKGTSHLCFSSACPSVFFCNSLMPFSEWSECSWRSAATYIYHRISMYLSSGVFRVNEFENESICIRRETKTKGNEGNEKLDSK